MNTTSRRRGPDPHPDPELIAAVRHAFAVAGALDTATQLRAKFTKLEAQQRQSYPPCDVAIAPADEPALLPWFPEMAVFGVEDDDPEDDDGIYDVDGDDS
jgi:hypothetical protein